MQLSTSGFELSNNNLIEESKILPPFEKKVCTLLHVWPVYNLAQGVYNLEIMGM